MGLALCLHHGALNAKVKNTRQELGRPSLGQWLNLLKAITAVLSDQQPTFLSTNLRHTYRGEPIAEAVQVLSQLTGLKSPKSTPI